MLEENLSLSAESADLLSYQHSLTTYFLSIPICQTSLMNDIELQLIEIM